MERYSVNVHNADGSFHRTVEEDIRLGLTGIPKSLPPKYFYDSRGSELFEHITRLPEYYLTRVETGLLTSLVEELIGQVRPQEVVELGSGSPEKIRLFLDAPNAAELLRRYVPFDVNEGVVRESVETIARDYPFLQAHGVVGDFEKHLVHLPPPVGQRLMILLGSTIGNLDPEPRRDFLLQLRQQLSSGDRLLLGLDLVKDYTILEAAYNDTVGITAEFNRNILRVVNRSVQGDFVPEAFQHYAYYNQEASRIEMHLEPTSPQTVNLRDFGLTITVLPGETIWTESSYKFTRESTEAMLTEAGMCLQGWYTDSSHMFALAIARPE